MINVSKGTLLDKFYLARRRVAEDVNNAELPEPEECEGLRPILSVEQADVEQEFEESLPEDGALLNQDVIPTDEAATIEVNDRVDASQADKFLEKYADGDDSIQVLRQNIMNTLSCIYWIKESNNENEQWALDYVDALNELSCTF